MALFSATVRSSEMMLFVFAGAALVLLGAGMIVSNPQVRRYLGDLDINGLAQGAMPDFERYMKLRSM